MIGMTVASSTRGVLTKQVQAVPEGRVSGRQIAAWHIDREGEMLSVVVTFDREGFAPDRAPVLALEDAAMCDVTNQTSQIENQQNLTNPEVFDRCGRCSSGSAVVL